MSSHDHGSMINVMSVVRRKGSHRLFSGLVTNIVKIETIKLVVRGGTAPDD